MEPPLTASAGESANPCMIFFLCYLRYLLLIHFPFESNSGVSSSFQIA